MFKHRMLQYRVVLVFFVSILMSAQGAHGVVTAAADNYRLSVLHRVISTAKPGLDSALALELSITNAGATNLHDLRIFLVRADGEGGFDEQRFARVRSLPAGAQADLNWTFHRSGGTPLLSAHGLRFRIEAVDDSTQQIVAFEQASVEVR